MSIVDDIRKKLAEDHVVTPYYDAVEDPALLSIFWSDGIFKNKFDQLDLTNVIDLACGHGRHAAQIVDRARQVIVVDINRENIAYCRNRFKAHSHVSYVTNDGS